ncbi:Insulin-like growth factor binding protein, N-terminal [Pseudocohnilembus persalinus]|uniref:Insulin-like growth factor binding protein, N-terminal n=1 Tax=Pseudocohnilembus persalinus TaxID=266149 RepID=A0A0V0R704_PSEPJ|nr:Insulin-like growth factor binding protein, N-terminal [Pseudocohnilembus persalinus]|eukprot:KRX09944.1 Insulin-like growth factor binding protein, N-terminal [Pseudocohnilembus persalinus]
MSKFTNKINQVILFCWIIVIFNPVQAIQLDTTQWQEVDITNNFITQSFVQDFIYGYSRVHDSLKLSQTKYANLIRSSSNPGEILIQFLDEYGNQQCSQRISVVFNQKYSLTNTNVEGEFFLAYTSYFSNIYQVFFGFLDESCNFSRGLSAPDQPDDFTNISFLSILAKTGKDNVYVVSQTFFSPYYLYLMILGISDTSTYGIKKHVKLGISNFRENLFSIQAFSDDYAVIFARNTINKLQKITINSDGNDVWDTPQNQGIFLDLNNISNFIQNKAIQIENTNKYSIVTGDYNQYIFTIYTFQYNGDGEIQDICLKTYSNQFGSMGIEFFYALEFGVINQDFVWVKGDNQYDNRKSFIFFANPMDCQVYRNPDDSSIYKYQLEHFSRSHIFHTYYSNQTVSLIASSSYIDGSSDQNLQAIRISIEENCPKYCAVCIGFENCDSCVSANVQRNVNNQCKCPDKYYQDQLSDDCSECPQYCEICTDQFTCQSCISSDGERDVSNLCICKDGYYQDTENDNCLECPQYCEICTDQFTCQSCISSDGERDVSNLCKCIDGYYQDGESDDCIECSEFCATCSNKQSCDSCPFSSALRDKNNKCSCINRYYQDKGQETCLLCPPICDICSSYNQCETCTNPNFIGPNCNLSKNEYFLDENKRIKKCPSKCIGCDGESRKCIKCQEGNRQDLSKNCDCLPGFHDNWGLYKKCIKCPLFCKNCIDENYCTECDDGYVLNKITNKCGKCAHGEIWNQFTEQCQECFYYKKQCLFYCPDNTIKGKFNTCIEKVYKEQTISHEKQLIYLGICYILQLIIFGILMVRKVNKIIKYVSEEHLNNIKKEYEQQVEEEYQMAIEQNLQQINKLKLFDFYLRRDISKYQKKIEAIFKKIQEHPNVDSELKKLKKDASFLITQQSVLQQIYKDFIKEHGYQNKKKKKKRQQQIQTNTIANTQNQDSLQIQVQRSQNRPQMKKKKKKRKEKEKEIKKIYNHQDSSSITIENKDNIKQNNNNNDNDNQNDIEINYNQNNINKKIFVPLKQ